MRELAVNTFMSLDGIMQAPGGPDEDPTGGFTHGGWGVPYFDDAPMDQIMRLRRRATSDFGIKDGNNGYGHEKAFLNIVERWGTNHEAQLLPRSFGDGSLVKGQLAPEGAKQ